MPDESPRALSDKGLAALNLLRDIRLESGVMALDDLLLGVCAFYHVPLTSDGKKLVSSLAPVSRNPKLAVDTFMAGAQRLEAELRPQDEIVRTSFGPLVGLSQSTAQQKVRDAITTLKVEVDSSYKKVVQEAAAHRG